MAQGNTPPYELLDQEEKREQVSSTLQVPPSYKPIYPSEQVTTILQPMHALENANVQPNSISISPINNASDNSVGIMGAQPMLMKCPICRTQIITKTTHSRKWKAHLLCLLMLCTILCAPFCCIPYCIDSFKVVSHKCPNCNTKLGTFRG